MRVRNDTKLTTINMAKHNIIARMGDLIFLMRKDAKILPGIELASVIRMTNPVFLPSNFTTSTRNVTATVVKALTAFIEWKETDMNIQIF